MAKEQSVRRESNKEARHNPESSNCNHADAQQFGRRIEPNRTWTVYHVFSGAPARHGSNAMTGLSRSEATEGMLALNRRDTERLKNYVALPSPSPNQAVCRE